MKVHPCPPHLPHLSSHCQINVSSPGDSHHCHRQRGRPCLVAVASSCCRNCEGAMPRYTVHVRGEWLAVPCGDAQLSVGWLGREAVRRYMKNKPDNGGFASVDDVHFLVRRCKGLGLLDSDDPLEVALEDNEFVEVGE